MIEVLHIIIVLVISPRFPPVSLIAIYVKISSPGFRINGVGLKVLYEVSVRSLIENRPAIVAS